MACFDLEDLEEKLGIYQQVRNKICVHALPPHMILVDLGLFHVLGAKNIAMYNHVKDYGR